MIIQIPCRKEYGVSCIRLRNERVTESEEINHSISDSKNSSATLDQ